jgi:hypothetical protein
MKNAQHESLRSGAPSQSGDLSENPNEREAADAAIASDRIDEAAPQHAEAGDGDVGSPTGGDRSIDRGMASPGAASQAEASARHATENLPEHDRTPKR